jgi:8-oxo-dGTP pyrophosphatase MutT (NUDIX family)
METDLVPQPAATVIVIRQRAMIEVLLLRRAAALAFHGGSWVFPGGRIDPDDERPGAPEAAARQAAVREAFEEAALRLDAAELIPFSHWTTPAGRPRRFATSFFLAAVEGAEVVVDGHETSEHQWIEPGEALANELALPIPTYTSLLRLARYGTVEEAVRRSREARYVRFAPKLVEVVGGSISVYAEDAAYDEPADLDRPGIRHRLSDVDGVRTYEAPPELLI